jgi:ABC-type Fe3+-hydroxamate transport system substrate-binding protein
LKRFSLLILALMILLLTACASETAKVASDETFRTVKVKAPNKRFIAIGESKELAYIRYLGNLDYEVGYEFGSSHELTWRDLSAYPFDEVRVYVDDAATTKSIKRLADLENGLGAQFVITLPPDASLLGL